jgi:excisionase family DNA binding protein
MTVPRMTLTMAELAEALGVDRVTVYRLLKKGTLDIPVLHIGGSSRVRVQDVEAYLERLADEARMAQEVLHRRRNGRIMPNSRAI